MAGALSKLDNVLEQGDFIVISGSGGGLGHIGVQIAARIKKLRVIAVDAGEEKRKLSLSSGAEVFIDYRDEDVAARVHEITGEGAHATIVVPGTREAFAMAPNVVRNMGLIVCVGLPPNDMDLPISATACAARGTFVILVLFISAVESTADQGNCIQVSQSSAHPSALKTRWASFYNRLQQDISLPRSRLLISRIRRLLSTG
jgi:D-arabinose 1-dehydrogenase-like Zn-dependent alcohol dehydrogenase